MAVTKLIAGPGKLRLTNSVIALPGTIGLRGNGKISKVNRKAAFGGDRCLCPDVGGLHGNARPEIATLSYRLYAARTRQPERGGCFGFRDLASARQIAKLLSDGVRLSEIVRGVSEIRRWLPEVGLSNVRFRAGAHNSLEIEQPGGRTDKRGQFLFAVDGLEQSPDELFARAQSAEEMGDIVEAERLYRLLMKSDPADASPPFNLGNMLRANGRYVEAEAAFRTATRTDPTFAQAWYNLGDLLDDQGRTDAAIDCLRKALQVAPNYADAMFNLALLLQRTSRYPEAAHYWGRYLASDGQSEWATRARRSLKFCEMQVHLAAAV
jgi:tetratricopeptide (TPR) repeat protein